jgi:hypothetical protein
VAWLSSLFGSSSLPQSEGTSAVDAVTYLASLASNPREIDLILDDLRQVTAHMTPGTQLSEADQKRLADVYTKLTDYLVEKESLRKFTREELIDKVRGRFKADAASMVFWQKVTT